MSRGDLLDGTTAFELVLAALKDEAANRYADIEARNVAQERAHELEETLKDRSVQNSQLTDRLQKARADSDASAKIAFELIESVEGFKSYISEETAKRMNDALVAARLHFEQIPF